MRECPVCGGALPDSASTGRPRAYCSPICRKRAELARRKDAREARIAAMWQGLGRFLPRKKGP